MKIRGKRGRRKTLLKLSVLFRESSLARPSTSNMSKRTPAGFLNSLKFALFFSSDMLPNPAIKLQYHRSQGQLCNAIILLRPRSL